MACMTHDCLACGAISFGNNLVFVCAKCGSRDIVSHYDDYEDDRDDDRDEEDEE